jgi:hypothetical protein
MKPKKNQQPQNERQPLSEDKTSVDRKSWLPDRLESWCVVGTLMVTVLFSSWQGCQLQKSIELDQRPWVAISSKDVHLRDILKDGTTNLIGVTYENSGKSPALNTAIRATSFYDERFPLPDGNLALTQVAVPRVTIPPNGSLNTPVPITPLDSNEFSKLGTGQLHLYVICNIDYEDIFKNKRRSEFCLVLKDPTKTTMSLCDNHNYMD